MNTLIDENKWRYTGKVPALTVPYDQDGVVEFNVCLSAEFAPIFLGLVEHLAAPYRWLGTVEEVEFSVEEMERLALQYKAVEVCGMSDEQLIKIIIAQSEKIGIEIDLADIANPGSTAPDAPDTTFDSDTGDDAEAKIQARRAALCAGVDRYVRTAFQAKADEIRASGYITAGALGILGYVHPVFGVAAVVTTLAVEAMAAAFEDDDAIGDVVCCQYESLVGRDATFEEFALTPDDCGFTFPDNNAQLAGYLRNANQTRTHYLMFMRALGEEYRRALIEETSTETCQCESGCIELFDFENVGKLGWYRAPNKVEGEFVPGEGFASTNQVDGRHRLWLRHNCDPEAPDHTADVEYTYEGALPTGGDAIWWVGYDNDLTELYADGSSLIPGRNVVHFDAEAASTPIIALEMRGLVPASRTTIHNIETAELP